MDIAVHKNWGSHIDASHSRQPLVKGERLVRYEVNAVIWIWRSFCRHVYLARRRFPIFRAEAAPARPWLLWLGGGGRMGDGRKMRASLAELLFCRRRPYRVECTGSLSTSEVKQRRARLVLGWGTAWEDFRVLSAFRSSACTLARVAQMMYAWHILESRIPTGHVTIFALCGGSNSRP